MTGRKAKSISIENRGMSRSNRLSTVPPLSAKQASGAACRLNRPPAPVEIPDDFHCIGRFHARRHPPFMQGFCSEQRDQLSDRRKILAPADLTDCRCRDLHICLLPPPDRKSVPKTIATTGPVRWHHPGSRFGSPVKLNEHDQRSTP